MQQIGDRIEDLTKLDPDFDWCVVLNSHTDVSTVDVRKYNIERNMHGGYVVTVKPRSFNSYVKSILGDLKNFTGEDTQIRSFGNVNSERATIYAVAKDLGMNIRCSKMENEGSFTVYHDEKKSTSKPNWVKKIIPNEPTKIKFEGLFSNFRRKVYRYALSNNLKMKVIPDSETTCVITLEGSKKELKSNMSVIKSFLDSIPCGESLELPESLSLVSDNYIRVLCSKHENDLSFTKGKVNHHTNGPRIDSKKNFVYNGKNFGKREPAFIRLKLSHSEYDAEQFIKDNM